MNKSIMEVSKFLIIVSLSFSVLWAQSDPTINYSQPTKYSIIFDSNKSIVTGSDNILTIHKYLTDLEDQVFNTHWFAENKSLGKTGNIIGRLAKYTLIDIPLSYALITIQHEYYGHGSRYREFNLGKVEYHYDLPTPYGPSGGYARISSWPDIFNIQKKIAIWHAGFDSHDMLNKNQNLKWVKRGSSNYHENILYLWTWQDRFQYIQSFDVIPENVNGPMYDPEGYVWLLNNHAGIKNRNGLKMDLEDLQRKDMLNLLNPFVWYSLYAQLKNYMFDGKTATNIPMLDIGRTSFIPSFRTVHTPFGPEYHLENYIKYNDMAVMVNISKGDNTFFNNWWGMGVKAQDVYNSDNISFDVNLNIWNQPEISIANDLANKLGAAVSFRLYYNVFENKNPFYVVTEMGYKSSGYIQGYDLNKTLIFQLGVGSMI